MTAFCVCGTKQLNCPKNKRSKLNIRSRGAVLTSNLEISVNFSRELLHFYVFLNFHDTFTLFQLLTFHENFLLIFQFFF